jgi:hypothetical protein
MRSLNSTVALVTLALLLSIPVVGRQQDRKDEVPISYVCIMPGDEAILEDKPGICPNPKCKMQLVPVRLVSRFSCQTHPAVIREAPGKCPLDQKDLVQVTLSEFWTCPERPDDKLMAPKRCADGKNSAIKYEVRAHGDHNPRHDGQFFMAEDAWHHLEGTYPEKGRFRVFFYDNYTRPLAPKAFTGSLDVLGDKDRVLGSFPLRLSRNGETLEASIKAPLDALPLKAAALIKLSPNVKEQKFNFVFAQYSKDPAAATPAPSSPAPARAPATTTSAPPATPPASKPAAAASSAPSKPAPKAPPVATAAAPSQAPAPPAPAPPAPASATPSPDPAAPPTPPAADQASTPDANQGPIILDKPISLLPALAEALDETKLPTDTPGLLAELSRRASEVEALVNEGNLSQVWLPATGTKTVALVLESQARSLPDRQRTTITFAVKRIVTAAWEMDAYGDLGNKQKLAEAYHRMATALTELKAAYEAR